MSGVPSVREISSLPLPPPLVATLREKGFRFVSDLAGMRPLDLAEEVGITAIVALQVLNAVKPSEAGSVPGVSAKDLFKDPAVERHIVMFCKTLDGLLGGGVPTGQLTEFCGSPGIGKTQLGIQLALDVQIPEAFRGRGGSAIYLDTEGSFMPERAAGMAAALERHIGNIARADAGSETARAARLEESRRFSQRSLLEGIHVFRAHDLTEQLAIINHFPAFVNAYPLVKLIVIDSIAFHFRQDMNVATRGRVLSGLAQTLNELAFKHNLAVVVMNHVTTQIDPVSRVPQQVPALGEHWSHCVTNRIFLRWEGGTRVATLTKSPSHPPGEAIFVVTEDGVRGVPSSSSGSNGSSSRNNGNRNERDGDEDLTRGDESSGSGNKRQRTI